MMAFRASALSLLLLGGTAAVAEPEPMEASSPASPEAMEIAAEIRRLRAELDAAIVPSEQQIERKQRSVAALGEARDSVQRAAAEAAGRRRAGERLLAASIGRFVRESRHYVVGPIYAQRLRTALALSGDAAAARITTAQERSAVAHRLAVLARTSEGQLRLLRGERTRVAARRVELQRQIEEAELALSRIPPPPQQPMEVVIAEAEPSPYDLGELPPDPAIVSIPSLGDPPPPAAGPPGPQFDDLIGDLDHLALLAPDADPRALGPAARPGPLRPSGWPIAGQMSRGFDEEGLGPLDRGLTFVSDLEQPVRTPRGGTIVFAGSFRSFGLLLIVDHGHEYHSLLAGVTRLDVRVGDVVVAGQIVGSIAGSEEVPAHLYLELRHNGRPVNPLPWLAAREDKVRG